MKKMILLMGSMTIATAGFCGVGHYSDATICHIYKQDKLYLYRHGTMDYSKVTLEFASI